MYVYVRVCMCESEFHFLNSLAIFSLLRILRLRELGVSGIKCMRRVKPGEQ